MAASRFPYVPDGVAADVEGEPLAIHPDLLALGGLWNEVRGDRCMPARRDFTPERLRPWLGNLALIDVSEDPLRLHYRLVGTNIVESLKFDPTGKDFEEFVVDPLHNPLTRGLYRCLFEAQPVFEVVRPKYNRYFSFDYNRLSLPLSADGRAVSMILMGEYVLSRSQPPLSVDRREHATKIWF